jgi:hypothetical protein
MEADIYFPNTSSAPESLPFILGRTLLSTASTIASARTLRAMRSTMLLSPLPSTTYLNTTMRSMSQIYITFGVTRILHVVYLMDAHEKSVSPLIRILSS